LESSTRDPLRSLALAARRRAACSIALRERAPDRLDRRP
jgi:hypothetical protein